MMKTIATFVVALLSVVATSLHAQAFMPPAESFSRQKTAYINLEDGAEVAGTIDKIKRTKGLISLIVVVDSVSGNEMQFKPELVKSMYLPPSGWDKFARGADIANRPSKWSRDDIDARRLVKDYVYFEKAEVALKKGKQTLMMQLLNPTFSGRIKVFHDPLAQETGRTSVGGFTVAGGDDRSYYFQKGDAPAFKVTKKTYPKEFKSLFGDCSSVMQQYGKKIKWSEIEAVIFEYNTGCE
jgi:hypothetical protein